MLAISSDVKLPSKEGVEFTVGTLRLVVFSLARAAGDKQDLGYETGDRGAVADFCSFWIVGHAVGEGMTSDGKLSRRISARASRALMELEHLRGTIAESSSDTSYRSSKSVVQELVLSLADEDGTVEDIVKAGEVLRLVAWLFGLWM